MKVLEGLRTFGRLAGEDSVRFPSQIDFTVPSFDFKKTVIGKSEYLSLGEDTVGGKTKPPLRGPKKGINKGTKDSLVICLSGSIEQVLGFSLGSFFSETAMAVTLALQASQRSVCEHVRSERHRPIETDPNQCTLHMGFDIVTNLGVGGSGRLTGSISTYPGTYQCPWSRVTAKKPPGENLFTVDGRFGRRIVFLFLCFVCVSFFAFFYCLLTQQKKQKKTW